MADEKILELRSLLWDEWKKNHDRECPSEFENETESECEYPLPEVLRKFAPGEIECHYCGEPFMQVRSFQKFCTTKCRVADWKRWNNPKSTAEDAVI